MLRIIGSFDNSNCEMDHRREDGIRLVAAHCDAFELLEFAWRHPCRLVISTRPAQFALGRLAHPIAQAGTGYTQHLGHHSNSLT